MDVTQWLGLADKLGQGMVFVFGVIVYVLWNRLNVELAANREYLVAHQVQLALLQKALEEKRCALDKNS